MAFHNVPPNGFPDLPDMEELEAVVKDVSGIKTSVAGLTEDVSDLNDNKANQITIAPFFSAETAYEVGDLVYYNGLTYRCTNDHEGEWDADDFAATTISGELDTLKSGLTNLKNFVNCSDAIALESGVTLAGKTLYFNGSVLYGSVVLDISQLSGSTIGHMISGYRPIAKFNIVSMSYATSTDEGSSSFVTFETNGNINIDHTAGKPYLVFSFSYPIAN